MANFLSGFLNNVGQGITNPKGTLGDFAHASRLYNSQAFRLAPKVSFLYHVVFNINPAAARSTKFDTKKHGTAINMLVKEVDLPKYKIQVDTAYQYNRKRQVQTKLEYDPISVVFHDDNVGLTTGLWNMYYSYYFADSTTEAAYKINTFSDSVKKYRYGLDNGSTTPFFSSIMIYQMARHKYQSYTLVNPIITSWQHDHLNNAESNIVQSTMSVAYESVIYNSGMVASDMPPGFATDYYDKSPSPLTLAGGGTTSILGQGGLLDGLIELTSPESYSSPTAILGTLIKGANTISNAKKLSKAGISQEGSNIIKSALAGVSGASVSGVANTLFPKASTSPSITTSSPTESASKNVTSAGASFAAALSANSSVYSNAAAAIAKSAGIPGLPTTSAEYSAMNATQQAEVISKISNAYDSGNPKVVGMINKLMKK